MFNSSWIGEAKMYIPFINDDKCTNCLACARICPKLVLKDEDCRVCVFDPSKCTGCESCSAVCPQNAIKIDDV
ncbi:4Fe-4S binding protein [Desulfomonile tiedjei]|uniref:4Fe-4S binding protein n=1 Tax=Desulfomonile tiedjei TaxID=2358 RepID=UPI000A011D94